MKADIKHYFDTVDHGILVKIINRKVNDSDTIWLVRTILKNYNSGIPSKGMPLGNWTSQFFANIYLNELDQFVKHSLRVTYYIRYVDDFVILYHSWKQLLSYQIQIANFLATMHLELHPTKCSIAPLSCGINFLGFKLFPYHRVPRKNNVVKMQAKLGIMLNLYSAGFFDSTRIIESLDGWFGYAMQGNTYFLRKRVLAVVYAELEELTTLRKTT